MILVLGIVGIAIGWYVLEVMPQKGNGVSALSMSKEYPMSVITTPPPNQPKLSPIKPQAKPSMKITNSAPLFNQGKRNYARRRVL